MEGNKEKCIESYVGLVAGLWRELLVLHHENPENKYKQLWAALRELKWSSCSSDQNPQKKYVR